MNASYGRGNRVLDALSGVSRAAIVPLLELVPVAPGDVIDGPGSTRHYVDFPIDAVLSVVADTQRGDMCEVGTIGNEGVSGSEVAFGASVLRRIFCQVSGASARIEAERFATIVRADAAFGALIARVEHAQRYFVEQQCACNGLHSITERCARWLLLLHDRVGRDEFDLTQEFLSVMLGVRRASVSEAAELIASRGAITYRRGRMTILNRAVLEAMVCECHAVTRRAFDNALRMGDRDSALLAP